jgi:site-specific recombinase XerD
MMAMANSFVRHNFGTEMASEGMPLPALASLLGHSEVKTKPFTASAWSFSREAGRR